MAGNFIIGQIRTWTPIIVGAFISWLVAQGVLDPGTAEAAQQAFVIGMTAVIQGTYYLAARLLAERWGWVGYALGYNKAPDYQTPASIRSADGQLDEGLMNVQNILMLIILILIILFLAGKVL